MSDDWIKDPEAWNKVRLGPVTLPGVSQVTMSRGREIDFKKAPGKDGGTSTDKGANAAKIKIRVTMNARQWREEWLKVIPQLEPAQGKPSGPFGIVHPEPNSRGIGTVEINDIASAPPTAKGGIVYDIDCQQWFPRAKDTKKKDPAAAYMPKLFTNKGTDEKYRKSLVLPSEGEALDAALGPGSTIGPRADGAIFEDPETGTLSGPADPFFYDDTPPPPDFE